MRDYRNGHNDGTWISVEEARRRLGVGRPALIRMMDARRFTVRQLPGMRTKLLATDIQAYLDAAVKPAVETGA